MRKQKKLLKRTNKDIIIILDACRYDYFKEVNIFDGELSKVKSIGATTPSFYEALYEEDMMEDRVSLTANTQKWQEDIFKKRLIIGKSGLFRKDIDPWLTLDNIEKGIDRYEKLLIHLVPPHLPWLTPSGIRLLRKYNYGRIKFPNTTPEQGGTWEEKFYPKVGEDRSKLEYKRNILYALGALKRIEDKLGGRSIITADHGECIGEYGEYGHFVNTEARKSKEIREIPWLVIE